MYTPQEFFNLVRPLQNPDDIQKYCEELKTQFKFDKPGTLVNKLKKVTAYTKFFRIENGIGLTKDELTLENSYQKQIKRGVETRHLYFKFMGFDDADYYAVNTKSITTERLTNQQEIDVTSYFERALTLFKSDNVWELATVLIILSGRRPTEILYSGDFVIKQKTPDYLIKEYTLYFSGQLKQKNSEHPDEFFIGTLISAKEFLNAFKKFRNFPEMREHHTQAKKMLENGMTEIEINSWFKNKLNSIYRVIDKFFPELIKESDDSNHDGKCSKLRAIYGSLLATRDCPKKINRALFIAWNLGHIPHSDTNTDRDLQHIVTSISYQSFYPSTEEIPYLTIEGDKTVSIRVTESARTELNKLAEEWGVNQAQALDLLLLEYNKLKEGHTVTKTVKRPENPEDIDSKQLFNEGIRFVGSASEKIRRCYQAITTYNDNATENRIAITNQILRTLSGCNGGDVSKWLREHQDEVITHHTKYGLSTKENELTTYYNKRYGVVSINNFIEEIKQNYLC